MQRLQPQQQNRFKCVLQTEPVLDRPPPFLQAAAELLKGLAEGHLRVMVMVRHAVLTQHTLAG